MKERPIGFFDSGFGGVSVLREAIAAYPSEDFIYYGDHGHIPYGEKSAEEIGRLVDRAVDELLAHGIKALVIACNTATSVSADRLRARLSIPVIGMEPALKPASALRRSGKIIVLATTRTLALTKFHRLYERYGEGAVCRAAPDLVALVEEGCLSGPRVEAALRALCPPEGDPIDGVVLGCTHFSFLREAIQRYFGPGIFIIDGNAGTVAQMARLLDRGSILRVSPLRRGSVELITSGDAGTVARRFWRLLDPSGPS